MVYIISMIGIGIYKTVTRLQTHMGFALVSASVKRQHNNIDRPKSGLSHFFHRKKRILYRHLEVSQPRDVYITYI